MITAAPRRNLLTIIIAVLCAVIIGAVPALGSTVAGSTAFTVSGTRILHDPPFPEQLLPGYFAGATISRVDYPAALFGMDRSIAVAVKGLDAGLLTTPGPLIAAGFSQGAIAVANTKKSLMALPADQRPAPDRLTFVTIGDPAGPGGILKYLHFRIPVIGLTPVTEPQTPYDSVIVNGEYDGWADFPDRPWNLVAVANALLGTIYVHGRYETVPGGLSLSGVPAANITPAVNGLGGRTTSYLIPTPKLPLVQPLRDIGVPEKIVAALEKPLKKVVDKGYTRNDAVPPSAAPVAAVRAAATTASPGRRGASAVQQKSVVGSTRCDSL